jgi:hypothetical protein
MPKRIVLAAINAAYGSLLGCIVGIVYSLFEPKQDWAAITGFVSGTIAGAGVTFLPKMHSQPESVPKPMQQ